MVIGKGEKVFIVTRRLFDGDLRRHFAGEVQEATDTVIRVRGFVFVYDEDKLCKKRRCQDPYFFARRRRARDQHSPTGGHCCRDKLLHR